MAWTCVRRFRVKSIFLPVVFLLSACGQATEPQHYSGISSGKMDDVTALPLKIGSPASIGDYFYIESAKIIKDTLQIEVSASGGCEEHLFDLYWDGSFLESYPVQTKLTLTHDSQGDICEAIIRKTLVFDLSSLKKSYQSGYLTQSGTIIISINNEKSLSYSFDDTAIEPTVPEVCAPFGDLGYKDFFQESSYSTNNGESFKNEQLIAAVKRWYGAKTIGLSVQELDALGEGVIFSTMLAEENGQLAQRYQAVNVGFGGGNSVTYFFDFDTLDIASFQFIDGIECQPLDGSQSVFYKDITPTAKKQITLVAKDFIKTYHAISLNEWGIDLDQVSFKMLYKAEIDEVHVFVDGVDIFGSLILDGMTLDVIEDRIAFDPEVG